MGGCSCSKERAGHVQFRLKTIPGDLGGQGDAARSVGLSQPWLNSIRAERVRPEEGSPVQQRQPTPRAGTRRNTKEQAGVRK